MIISLIIALVYVWIIGLYLSNWRQLPSSVLPEDFRGETFISVIVPARNEAHNIASCLDALLRQDYPSDLYEVIVVDDYSTDETSSITQSFRSDRFHLIQLSKVLDHPPALAFKKKAIEVGIRRAKGTLIATIDADCMAPREWLRYLAFQLEKHNAAFIAGPVSFYQEANRFEKFQALDFLGMMIITGAGIQGQFMHMCNGANLAYTRVAFERVDGFAGIDHIASGDDMLLMQKVVEAYPEGISFIKAKEALVLTKAKPDVQSFIRQRVRWATKSNSYREKQVTAILAVVFLLCTFIVASFLLIPFWGWPAVGLFSGLLIVKTLADYRLLSEATRFFGRRDLMVNFCVSQVFHVLYIVLIGVIANLRKEYEWKGRRVQ